VIRRLPILAFIALALVANACGRYLTTGAAVVNGTSISKDELDREVAAVLSNPQFQGSIDPDDPEQRSQIERQVILQLVRTEVIKQEAARIGVDVGERELNQRLQQIRAQFPSDAEFQQRLRQSNLTEERLREQLQIRLVEEALIPRVGGAVPATEEEIRAAYGTGAAFEEIKVRHILFLVQGTDEAAARTKAEAVLAQLNRGADFATLARQQSEDPGSKESGGDLGTITRDAQFDETFKNAAFALKAGQTSGLVRTQFGFHIIRVDTRTAKTLDQVRAQLAQQINDTKGQQAFQEWLVGAVQKAKIIINPRYGDFDPASLQIQPHQFFVPPSPEPETEPIPLR
jgi:parvulin-like peptidyl-prolyl isomerase